MDNSIDIEDLIEQRKAETAVLRHSFLRDEKGKVNLNNQEDGIDSKEKSEFLEVSYSYLKESGLVPNDYEQFKTLDYDHIMDCLVDRLVVYNYPEYRSVKSESLYNGWAENNIELKKLNPTDYGLRADANIYDRDFSFSENYQDITFGQFVSDGIKSAVKFIKSL